jgi:primosomal protein N' (replication factor Y)
LPPTVRMAQLVGPRVAVQRAVELAGLAASVERLGPLPWASAGPAAAAGPGTLASAAADEAPPRIQLLLRAALGDGPALTAALSHMKAVRSAHKERDAVSVRVDPTDGLG